MNIAPNGTTMTLITANGINLAYDSFGDDRAEAVLLIAGLGTQRIRWTVPFCEGLAARLTSAISTAASKANSATNVVAGQWDNAMGRTQNSAISPVRRVTITSAVPGPRPGCRRVPHRRWRPPVPPPDEASPGAEVLGGPWP